MKKALTALLLTLLVLSFAGCGRISANVEITNDTSEHYTATEIHDAFDVAMDYFRREFRDCTMTAIGYIGDEKWDMVEGWASDLGAQQAIVLVSEFDTGKRGGDGSLNPNDTYRNYKWILVRGEDGRWSHADHGYG